MAKVTGIGGVFFKAENPRRLTDWYVEHLGLPVDNEGYVVLWSGGDVRGSTVWAPFPADETTNPLLYLRDPSGRVFTEGVPAVDPCFVGP